MKCVCVCVCVCVRARARARAGLLSVFTCTVCVCGPFCTHTRTATLFYTHAHTQIRTHGTATGRLDPSHITSIETLFVFIRGPRAILCQLSVLCLGPRAEPAREWEAGTVPSRTAGMPERPAHPEYNEKHTRNVLLLRNPSRASEFDLKEGTKLLF